MVNRVEVIDLNFIRAGDNFVVFDPFFKLIDLFIDRTNIVVGDVISGV